MINELGLARSSDPSSETSLRVCLSEGSNSSVTLGLGKSKNCFAALLANVHQSEFNCFKV